MSEEVLCDVCNSCFHLQCVGLPSLPHGFWYCEDCTAQIAKGHMRDITTDVHLMKYLFEGTLVEGLTDDCVTRVTKASEFLRVYQGVLYIFSKEGWRQVPAIADRFYIIEQLHGLAHIHADKMYLSLKGLYYWKGMRQDCTLYCNNCRACKSERAKFVKHQNLTPFDKGSAPFQVWCLDLIVGLPEGSQGETICVVCVDVFSKFVVACPLLDKSSESLATFFYTRIICEFSVPRAVRCDNGREFLGSFAALLEQHNIYRFPATPYYP